MAPASHARMDIRFVPRAGLLVSAPSMRQSSVSGVLRSKSKSATDVRGRSSSGSGSKIHSSRSISVSEQLVHAHSVQQSLASRQRDDWHFAYRRRTGRERDLALRLGVHRVELALKKERQLGEPRAALLGVLGGQLESGRQQRRLIGIDRFSSLHDSTIFRPSADHGQSAQRVGGAYALLDFDVVAQRKRR